MYNKYGYKTDEPNNLFKKKQILDTFKPSAIKKYLDQYIIGQDKAKKVISTAIYNHYKMIELKEKNKKTPLELYKSNIMIVGRSGTGKTAMLSRIAKVLKVPFAIVDANTITASG